MTIKEIGDELLKMKKPNTNKAQGSYQFCPCSKPA